MADFNDEKSKEILDLIKEKTGGFRCPLFNNGKINLIQREAVIPFPDEKEGNFVLSPQLFARYYFAIACSHCGYTVFFDRDILFKK